MSEVETASSRLRRGAKQRNSYGGGVVIPRPRTSPSQPSRSPSQGSNQHRYRGKKMPNINGQSDVFLYKDQFLVH